MRWRLGPIDIKVARCFRKHYFFSLQKLVHHDLTTQSRSGRQSKSQIQKIFLLIFRHRELTIDIRRQNYVTGRTCKTGLTCSFQLNIIGFCNLKKMLSLCCFYWLPCSVSFYEGKFDSIAEQISESSYHFLIIIGYIINLFRIFVSEVSTSC